MSDKPESLTGPVRRVALDHHIFWNSETDRVFRLAAARRGHKAKRRDRCTSDAA